jgi:peptide deformylase
LRKTTSYVSLKVIHYPHPTLRHRSRPLKKVDAQLRTWIDEMLDLMYEHEGVGLAANQVNLPYRVFVANPEGDPDIREAEFVFINPVLRGGKGSAEAEEGCLSIPQVFAPVRRNETIKIQAYNLRGEVVEAELNGLFARVVQHETDHLDGTLFIDRLPPAAKATLRDQLEEFELDWQSRQSTGEIDEEEAIAAYIARLESERT